MTLPNMSVVLPLVREGKLRALMAMAPARPAALPDVPTLAEAGFTGFDTTIWFGLMAPAGTPQPIVDKLYGETARVLAQNDARKHLQDLGMEIVANTPSEFATVIKSEIPQWAKLIKDAGIRINESNFPAAPRCERAANGYALSSAPTSAAPSAPTCQTAGLVARVLGCTAISACSKRAASRGEGGHIRSSYWARSARPSAINHAARFSDLMRLRSYMV